MAAGCVPQRAQTRLQCTVPPELCSHGVMPVRSCRTSKCPLRPSWTLNKQYKTVKTPDSQGGVEHDPRTDTHWGDCVPLVGRASWQGVSAMTVTYHTSLCARTQSPLEVHH